MTREEALKRVEDDNKTRPKALKWYFDTINFDENKVMQNVEKLIRNRR